MIRFIIPTLAQFRYLRNLRMKEREEALLAQQQTNQANICHSNTEVAMEQEEQHPTSPASGGSSDETTAAVSKTKDRNRDIIATPSHPSTKPVSQVAIPAVERIGVSESRDLDHSLSDLDDTTPTAAMHANNDDGKVEIDGDDDDESQATTWSSETKEKDETLTLDEGETLPQHILESPGKKKKSRIQESKSAAGVETAGLEEGEEEEAPKDSPILLQDGEESNATNRNLKPRPALASPVAVASKKSIAPLDPLSSPDESGSPVVKRSKRPWFGKGRKRKLQQTALKFGNI